MIPLVRIGNTVRLFDRRTPDDLGFGVGPNGISGLAGGVASTARAVSRPTAHGDFDIPGKLDSRIVAATGTCIARTPLQLATFGVLTLGIAFICWRVVRSVKARDAALESSAT